MKCKASTHLSDKEVAEIRFDVKEYALHGTRQSDATYKEDDQYDVGKERRKVDHLARRLDALAEAEKDENPSGQKGE